MEGTTCRPERHSMGVADRRSLGGRPRPLSVLPDCHSRFQQWVRSGIMKGVLEALALDLKIRGTLDVEEAFIDGSFAPAKKGVSK
jgi:hypothetical protein